MGQLIREIKLSAKTNNPSTKYTGAKAELWFLFECLWKWSFISKSWIFKRTIIKVSTVFRVHWFTRCIVGIRTWNGKRGVCSCALCIVQLELLSQVGNYDWLCIVRRLLWITIIHQHLVLVDFVCQLNPGMFSLYKHWL